MGNEKYVATFVEYGEENRSILELDSERLKDSLLEYIFEKLTNSWPETCCQSTIIQRPLITSLERISESGVEMVFPEKVDLKKLFGVEDLENAYETFFHDCTCADDAERRRKQDEEYYERRGF